MSFRITNPTKQIYYYTILLENDVELKTNQIKKHTSQKQKDRIVFDRQLGIWKNIQTYY